MQPTSFASPPRMQRSRSMLTVLLTAMRDKVQDVLEHLPLAHQQASSTVCGSGNASDLSDLVWLQRPPAAAASLCLTAALVIAAHWPVPCTQGNASVVHTVDCQCNGTHGLEIGAVRRGSVCYVCRHQLLCCVNAPTIRAHDEGAWAPPCQSAD
jgi:hypothetical protein